MRRLRAVILLALLSGCKFGSSGDSSSPPDPPPTSTPPPTPPSSPPPSAPPSGSSFASQAAAMYTVQPNIPACQAGQLTASVQSQVLATINRIRSFHRLPAVTYSISDEGPAMAAALMMAANGQLTHNPPSSFKCFTTNGELGAKTSNLHGGLLSASPPFFSNDFYIVDWLTDVRNAVAENVGHRRWILSPFIKSVGFGRVAGRADAVNFGDAAALKVIGNSGPDPSPASIPPFVAYPFEDYPADLFDPQALLSFTVIGDPTSSSANGNVNFSQASVAVRERNGATLAITRLRYDNEGFGVPNNIQFFVSGIRTGTTYDVTISNVTVGSALRNYSYYFRIIGS